MVGCFDASPAMTDQPSLFAPTDLWGCRTAKPLPPVSIDQKTLLNWKNQVFRYQQQVREQPPQQETLFELTSTVDDLTDAIDPFSLPRQNIEFWRWKAEDAGVSALYFVIDEDVPLLLYVGETVKSNQRWKGEHDCKRYVASYVSAHRAWNLPVAVNIGFWQNAPQETRPRQQLESALIFKWRSPFNKENWGFWKTPFVAK